MNQNLCNEKLIKKVFDDREISPSKKSWQNLESLLNEQMPQDEIKIINISKKKSAKLKIALSIASVFIAILSLIFWNLNNDGYNSNHDVLNKDLFVITKKGSNIIHDFKNTIVVNTDQTSNKNKNKLKNKKTSDVLIVSSFPVNNYDLSDVKVDSIVTTMPNNTNKQIQIAWEPIKIKEIEINTNNLIKNVERELIRDRVNEELDIPKDRFEKIRFAIINRNIQE